MNASGKDAADSTGRPDASAQQAQKPGLFERLRAVFGLGAATTREEFHEALDTSSPADDFSPQERAMLKNVLGLHELRVHDVMLPRADIIAVNVDLSLAEVLRVFRTAGHSRLPVHGDTLDDPRGMVHIRDFLDHLAAAAETPLARPRIGPQRIGGLDLTQSLAAADILRPVIFVPPSMPALDLLLKMQTTHTHMALVIDEYGGTDGLVSIEDIVEMIVGDIEDEHDETGRPPITAEGEGVYVVEGRADLDAVTVQTGIDFTHITDADDVDTVGGLITALAGRVPVRGEIVRMSEAVELEVLDADPRRVKRLKLHISARAPAQGAEQKTPAREQADKPA